MLFTCCMSMMYMKLLPLTLSVVLFLSHVAIAPADSCNRNRRGGSLDTHTQVGTVRPGPLHCQHFAQQVVALVTPNGTRHAAPTWGPSDK